MDIAIGFASCSSRPTQQEYITCEFSIQELEEDEDNETLLFLFFCLASFPFLFFFEAFFTLSFLLFLFFFPRSGSSRTSFSPRFFCMMLSTLDMSRTLSSRPIPAEFSVFPPPRSAGRRSSRRGLRLRSRRPTSRGGPASTPRHREQVATPASAANSFFAPLPSNKLACSESSTPGSSKPPPPPPRALPSASACLRCLKRSTASRVTPMPGR
mmetsp:Transcript_12551/g.40329  ORF Transcript_12551/g.40329 Transcript_12551/m.40329 type:complete len:212 (-) Transcript_12551:100-735(-)